MTKFNGNQKYFTQTGMLVSELNVHFVIFVKKTYKITQITVLAYVNNCEISLRIFSMTL